jgi:lipopolysaccharide transport protein LptA
MELAANDLKVNLTNRHAVFSGKVRAEDDKMQVTSEWLSIDGAEKGGADRILAKEKVVIINKDDKSRATGGEGLFVASNNVVTLTGKPMLENSQGKMWAEKIVLRRDDNELFANENVKMEVQAFAGKDAKSGKTGATNAPLILLANAAHINLTNRQAVYTGNVRADDSKMLITSDKLTVKGQGGSNKVDTILAEGRVTMTNRQDRSRATGGKAVYVADGEVLTLTGKPMLENDQGKLAGDTIVMDRARNLLTAKENVRTEIQPHTTAALISKTNAPSRAPEPMTVFSDDVKVNITNRVAQYRGNIRVESSQMELHCENMTVKSVQGTTAVGKTTNGVESIVAEGKVLIVNKADKTRARGNKAVYMAATDSIELTGEPVIEKEQGNLIVKVETMVIWHRPSNTLEAIGELWSTVNPKAFQKERSKTNAPPTSAAK